MDQLAPLIPLDDSCTSGIDGQRRCDARSNIFVVAALSSTKGIAPVRIRNMSMSGALIEGVGLPSERSAVSLSRGSLSVIGHIIWHRGERAGLKFDGAVVVDDWLPRSKGSSKQQQRIDEIVHRFKAGSTDCGEPSRPLPTSGTSLADELLQLRHALSAAADELASDAATRSRHLSALQRIDMAAQKLEQVARQVAPGAGLAL